MGRRQKTHYPRMEVELADKTLLPPRRAEVVTLADRGLTAKEIARELGIDPATVNWHLDEARDQFHAHSRVDLISQGWMRGLFRARVLAVFMMGIAVVPALRSRPSTVTAHRPPVVRTTIGRHQIRSVIA